PPEAALLLDRLDTAGQTALVVARDGRVVGVIGARDRVRPEAAGVVSELRELGIDPIVLLTGDRPAAANALAADLPFSATHAELLPEQKAKLIDELKSRVTPSPPSPLPQGARGSLATSSLPPFTPSPLQPFSRRPRYVAMLGDGINDA